MKGNQLLAQQYAQAVRNIVDKIEATQKGSIERAAEAVANSLANSGAFWLYRIGHGGEQELAGRAGGLLAASIFSFNFNTSRSTAECLRDRPRSEPFETDFEQVRLAVKCSEMRKGDVLMLASVSGRNRAPIELTLAAQELGVTVVAMTSLEYTAQVESLHPSGKKLCEVADIVIDNCAPFGDACVEAEGYSHKVLPISGVAQITIGWMICGQVIEKMSKLGKPAHVYMSANRVGGSGYNERVTKEYNALGY